ncbi:DNA-binding protein [Streptosporangium roseum]|uniref:DNA-binding protein n=1 Tax=Streptosporangium roseum TaxID=2001 RepID=UPI003321AB14
MSRMPRKQEFAHTVHADHAQAHREKEARQRLLSLGADALDARPWRPSPAPLSAVDLAQFAVWRCADLEPEDILSALALLPAARAEVEGLETGLLFAARSAGLTWAQMAHVMGFNSPQACQQRYMRLEARQDADS